MTSFTCPLPLNEERIITLAHGSGGKQTNRLIQNLFLPAFGYDNLAMLHDGALLDIPSQQIVFTTDSYVIQPVFFPGGDIGKLAVTGTLNDLAMCGAKPLYLSCGFIIEEGFTQDHLQRIVKSMQTEAAKCGAQIVTGDTKIIERQAGDNIFINTSGIGVCLTRSPINPKQIRQGDSIIISGDIGRHGMAVMAQREGLTFSSPLVSDCASLVPIVEQLLCEGIEIHCMRDLTRGGVATALVELAETAGMEFVIEEETVPVCQAVESACEILGFDPLYVANEGRFVAFVPEHYAERTLALMQAFSEGEQSSLIGHVVRKADPAAVILKNAFGTERYLYRLVGDQLPRIC